MKTPATKYSLPRLLQTSPNESGAVALGIALACFDKHLSIARLRKLTGTTQSGTTTDKLLIAIQQCGLIGQWIRCDNDDSLSSQLLNQRKLPAIVSEGNGKFYTLLECQHDTALVYSPTQGLLNTVIEDLSIESILALSLGPDFVAGGVPVSIWTPLYSLAAKVKSELILLVSLTITSVVPVILIAACTSQFVDQFLENKFYSFAIPIVWIAFISLIVAVSIRLLVDLVIRRLNFVLIRVLARDVYQYVMTKEPLYFSERPSGSIAYRMMAPYLLTYSIAFALLGPVLNLVFGLLLVVLSAFISFPLSLVLLFGSFLNIYSGYLTTMATSNELNTLQREQSHMNSALYAILQNVEEYKSISAEFAATNQWHKHFYNIVNIQQSVFIKNNFRDVISSASVFLTVVLVLCIGGTLVIQGIVSLGTLLAFLFIQSRVNVSLDAIPSISSAWQQLIGLLMSYRDLQQAAIDSSIDVFDRSLNLNKRTPVSLSESRDLELIDVSFATSDLDPPVFTGLGLSVSSGQHLLIESSQQDFVRALFHLISGLIQPSSGLISLGGVDINTYPTHSLRKEIVLVGSEIPFLDDSIENNIFLNRSFVVSDQLVPVCEAVGLDEFVNRYKDAYQSQLINPASYLSVSEKFQFSIARALIAQPSILILDFDVSKLDASVELSIYQFCRKHSITVISTFCRPAHQVHVDRVLSMSDLLTIA
ncbi:hypothetical protein CWE17_08860 [Synechococcus sp. BS56D]|uniref:cysteine peptidase family C39 domain-containing protein n=1 Tax=Synechococcus sp. BS56D TaxID=2055944 RepID=UPI00103B385F|nr:cysteine peptidase family C39 domain-containing protein [Synechococcus sp. BS56D]TCD56763.1 hypothetical protein CWE17_08860 [Synechococcus sp. BS56D]